MTTPENELVGSEPQLVDVRVVVRNGFQLPRGLDDPAIAEQILTRGAAAISDDLVSRHDVKKEVKRLRAHYEEQVSELHATLEATKLELDECRAKTLHFLEQSTQDKNHIIALQETQRDQTRVVTELSERLTIGVDVLQPSFEDLTHCFKTKLFPTAFFADGTDSFFIEVDGTKIWVCLSSTSVFTEDDVFHKAVSGATLDGAEGVLFVSLGKECRLIRGISTVFSEIVDGIPVIYLGEAGCQSMVVLQTCITLLRLLTTWAASATTNTDVIDDAPIQVTASQTATHARKTRVPKLTLEQVVTWLKERPHKTGISAEELCKLVPITTRNLNDLQGIGYLKELAYGIRRTRRGRPKTQGSSHVTFTYHEKEGDQEEEEGSPPPDSGDGTVL